jgi:two-component system sensor histidine kinase DesK
MTRWPTAAAPARGRDTHPRDWGVSAVTTLWRAARGEPVRTVGRARFGTAPANTAPDDTAPAATDTASTASTAAEPEFGRAAAPGPSLIADREATLSDLDLYMSPRGRFFRRAIIVAFIGYFVVAPAVSAVSKAATPTSLAELACVIAFTIVVGMIAVVPARPSAAGIVPWGWLAIIVALAITVFVIGESQNSLTILAVAAAACGRFSATTRPAIFGAASCAIAGLVVETVSHWTEGLTAVVLVMPPLAAFFSYAANRRNEMVATLRQTRAELARIAVAEERLRIARDLHDLLGHSLSLITLKAELSRRMMSTDTERAVRELADLEAVARQSLSDVRAAVTAYRQPDLAAELASARQLLTAAGVACRITTPDRLDLPADVDAVLAWAIREGITNVVRHAGATSATITVASDRKTAVAEITDDGQGSPASGPRPTTAADLPPDSASAPGTPPSGTPPASTLPGSAVPDSLVPDTLVPGLARLRVTGSGLAGLAERIRALGGDVAAGRIQPHGFRLRVTVPVGCPSQPQES